MTIRKRFHQEWILKCPEVILTCSILKCRDDTLIVFGGHDKKLYLMDEDQNILDQVNFDGWCRCSYSKDITGDECDEILVGSGDGSFLVLKLDQENKKLINLKHYKGIEKINACVAGDLYRKGNINLIFGDENNTINIFNSLSSKEPEITLYFDSWIMALDLAYFKIPDVSEQIIGLIAGTKNGILYFITFMDEKPLILWQKNLYSQINDIKIGDISNDGYNEIIACTNDSYVKILNSTGKKIYYMPFEESRPVSCLIEDIDGNNANEILIGCADGSLMVYENNEMNSVDFQLKWKTKIKTSIKFICSLKQNGNKRSSLLYGGYDRTIRKINDFEWGQKTKLEIPKRKFPQEVRIQSDNIEKEVFIETPKNMREHLAHIMKYHETLNSLDLIVDELMKIGYSKPEIDEELELLKENDCLIYGNFDKPLWIFNKEKLLLKKEDSVPIENLLEESDNFEILEKLALESQDGIINEKKQNKKDLDEQTSNLKEVIIEYLKVNEVIGSKLKIISGITDRGFSEEKVEQMINSLKENGIIKYSRSKPRGWVLI